MHCTVGSQGKEVTGATWLLSDAGQHAQRLHHQLEGLIAKLRQPHLQTITSIYEAGAATHEAPIKFCTAGDMCRVQGGLVYTGGVSHTCCIAQWGRQGQGAAGAGLRITQVSMPSGFHTSLRG